MLVNISYSIDFDEVPSVVRRFLNEDIKKILNFKIGEHLIDSINYLEPKEENIGKCIKSIEDARELLVMLDMRLRDCSSILRGYEKELIEPTETQPPSGELHEGGWPEADMSSLQQGLTNLKKALGEENNET